MKKGAIVNPVFSKSACSLPPCGDPSFLELQKIRDLRPCPPRHAKHVPDWP